MDKKCHHLIIDKEFKALSPLYSKDILSKAETDILLSGSLSSPIKVWGNTILTDFLYFFVSIKKKKRFFSKKRLPSLENSPKKNFYAYISNNFMPLTMFIV